MPWTNKHLTWLVKTPEALTTADGKSVEVWELRHNDDPAILKAWAKHFRNHYCLDTEIDVLKKGYKYSRKEYLENIKFPNRSSALGPSIRAGDFAEILVADYLQFLLGYWVPRTRYGNKTIRDESSKGCDTLGFKILKEGRESRGDTVALYEAKAQFSALKPSPRLQDAVDGSAKDHARKGESLNAIKQHLFYSGSYEDAKKIERFQNPEDHPYNESYGAVAAFSTSCFCKKTESKTDTSNHPHTSSLRLVVIRGDAMMDLVHELYRRAADEA